MFFEKGAPTRKVWYYQLNLDRNLGKTNSLNEADLAGFVELQKTFANSENSWSVDVSSLSEAEGRSPSGVEGYDLSAKNPNKKEETALRSPKVILEEMKALDAESNLILDHLMATVLSST